MYNFTSLLSDESLGFPQHSFPRPEEQVFPASYFNYFCLCFCPVSFLSLFRFIFLRLCHLFSVFFSRDSIFMIKVAL